VRPPWVKEKKRNRRAVVERGKGQEGKREASREELKTPEEEAKEKEGGAAFLRLHPGEWKGRQGGYSMRGTNRPKKKGGGLIVTVGRKGVLLLRMNEEERNKHYPNCCYKGENDERRGVSFSR